MNRFILSVISFCTWAACHAQLVPTHLESPMYPEIARRSLVQGKVLVTVTIDPDGRVVSAKAIGGHALLRKYAEENLRTWMFSHGDKESEKSHTQKIAFSFKLEMERREHPCTRV